MVLSGRGGNRDIDRGRGGGRIVDRVIYRIVYQCSTSGIKPQYHDPLRKILRKNVGLGVRGASIKLWCFSRAGWVGGWVVVVEGRSVAPLHPQRKKKRRKKKKKIIVEWEYSSMLHADFSLLNLPYNT